MSAYSDHQARISEQRGLAALTGSDSDISRADNKRAVVLAMIAADLEGQPDEDRGQLDAIVAKLRNQTSARFWLDNGASFHNTESALTLAMTL